MSTRTIKVDYLARVEGEGALYIKTKGKKVEDVKLKIFEPPRFFEAFLQGRRMEEAPDITARICGICPIAYQMSAVHAMESICGIQVAGPLRELRRLMYCGEWIESHTLHVYLLHAPDFLNYDDAVQLAKDHPQVVQQGLELKKAGNEMISFLAGREIHPINVRVGGFYKVPGRKKDFDPILEKLKKARELAIKTVKWAASLSFPDFEQEYEFVSLQHPKEYPLNEGRIVSNKGLNISIQEFEQHFEEVHVPHSNALHCVLKIRGDYLVGPMARYSLNFNRLSPLCQEIAREVGLESSCRNPFKSIIVRAIEILYACDEAIRIMEEYEPPDQPFMKYELKEGIGYGCTEAPRGILYHRYQVDKEGLIVNAKIVPPTSQNQKRIEHDLRSFVSPNIDLPKKDLTWKCEQAIRNYDPCISCATHFLKLKIENIS